MLVAMTMAAFNYRQRQIWNKRDDRFSIFQVTMRARWTFLEDVACQLGFPEDNAELGDAVGRFLWLFSQFFILVLFISGFSFSILFDVYILRINLPYHGWIPS